MDFRFTTEHPLSRLDEIVSYLLGPRLWIPRANYPDFEDWAQKAHRELRRGSKRAIAALSQDQVVGVIVYQRHKKFAETLELKNLTVRPDVRGRYIASFLIKNAEVEGAKDFKANKVIGDAKASNFGMRLFLMRHRYRIIGETDLYCLKAGNDIVYCKDLHPFLV